MVAPKRSNELRLAAVAVLANITVSDGTDGMRGVWMRGDADHAALFLRLAEVAGAPLGRLATKREHVVDALA